MDTTRQQRRRLAPRWGVVVALGLGLGAELLGCGLWREQRCRVEGAPLPAEAVPYGAWPGAVELVLPEGEAALPDNWYTPVLEKVGDVTGDGVDDLLVSALGADGRPVLHVVPGAPGPLPVSLEQAMAERGGVTLERQYASVGWGEEADPLIDYNDYAKEEWLGISVDRRIGDVDGDGVDDLAVRQWTTESTWVVYMGRGLTGRVTLEALGQTQGAKELAGQDPFMYRNNSIARVGDVDGDGRDDVAMTVDIGPEYGLYLVNGRLLQEPDTYTFDEALGQGLVVRAVNAQMAGWTLGQPLGDLDGDGRMEFVAFYDGEGQGDETELKIVRVPGDVWAVGGLDVAENTVATVRDGEFALGRLQIVPDLDGDGRAELVSRSSAQQWPYASVPGHVVLWGRGGWDGARVTGPQDPAHELLVMEGDGCGKCA